MTSSHHIAQAFAASGAPPNPFLRDWRPRTTVGPRPRQTDLTLESEDEDVEESADESDAEDDG